MWSWEDYVQLALESSCKLALVYHCLSLHPLQHLARDLGLSMRVTIANLTIQLPPEESKLHR